MDGVHSSQGGSALGSPAYAPGSFSEPGRASFQPYWRIGIATVILSAIGYVAWLLHHMPGRGAAASFSLLTGAALGVVMQRGRFCFFCIFREYIEDKDSRGFYSVLAALAVGSLCYTVFMSMFLPNPMVGRLPPDVHVGPVSWALVVAGLVFGLGMTLAGACVSGQLYRLGEGYGRAPFALVGTVIGFGLGFLSWRPLYLNTISKAPLPWLPRYAGYTGALALQLIVLGLLAIVLLRALPARKGKEALSGSPTSDVPDGSDDWTGGLSLPGRVGLNDVWQRVFGQRWSPGVTGSIVGVLGSLAYMRVSPLGVTSQLGSIARTAMSDAGMLAGRLNGLDGFAGCVTLVIHTISNNGLLISALVAASFAMAVVSKRFEWEGVTVRGGTTALLGGVLMGWGSMIALGCTVGTLLSGIMAMSVSGWVFFASVFAGVWVGVKTRLHRIK